MLYQNENCADQCFWISRMHVLPYVEKKHVNIFLRMAYFVFDASSLNVLPLKAMLNLPD